jgi:hypothetical protein
MNARLNGWQRLGVVVSGLWFAFILVLGAVSAASNGPFGKTTLGTRQTVRTEAVCSQPAPARAPGEAIPPAEFISGCAEGALVSPSTEKVVQLTPDRHRFYWGPFLIALIGPIVVFWLLAYGAVRVVKWVAKGFRNADQP